MRRFTLTDFLSRFANQRACLEYLAAQRWPDGIHCGGCDCTTKHHLIESRKCYSCQNCGSQTYPTAGTIFHKSRTPLPTWFYVIFQMAQTRCGVSAKDIQRQTGTTYKTAWRMCMLVRTSLQEKDETATIFSGIVEIDETYVGGKPRYKGQSRRGRGTRKKPVLGIIERGSNGKRVRAFVVDNVRKNTVLPIIEKNVEKGSTTYTDEYAIYRTLGSCGYKHDWVRHRRWEYAKEIVDEETGEVLSGDDRPIHTNSIEGFWSQIKGAITNVHRGVDPRYLQRYLDEFSFRYGRTGHEQPMFLAMLTQAARSEQCAARLP